MEMELWNLTVKGDALTSYNQRFQELTPLCTKMVPKEEDKVEKYIRGLLDSIQRNVIVVEPVRLQDAIRIANNLMDQKLKGYAIKNVENKRRFDNNSRDNHGQQQPFKRDNVNGQNVARAYSVGNNVERRGSPNPDREWHKTKIADKQPPQQWISQLAQASGNQSSFNEFLAIPIDFSAFIMNWLKIDNLTQDVLTDPSYDVTPPNRVAAE
ncbi:hypothetical protein Tco_0791669 [Tanacetum coccineum]